MLSPKRTKYRKAQKGNNRGTRRRGSDVSFGDFAMQAVEPGRVTSRQIEAARMAITRHVKRAGKLWIRVFPDRPVTKKPLEVRMGGGKGGVEEWAAQVQPGRVMYELSGVDEKTAREAFRLAGHKLPVGYKFLDPRSCDRMKAADLREKSVDDLRELREDARARRLPEPPQELHQPSRRHELDAQDQARPGAREDAAARARDGHPPRAQGREGEPPVGAPKAARSREAEGEEEGGPQGRGKSAAAEEAREKTAKKNRQEERGEVAMTEERPPQQAPSTTVAHGFRRKMVGQGHQRQDAEDGRRRGGHAPRDPLYGKYVRSRSRYKAHDEKGQFKVGDQVEIQEHRPISRDKRFIVTRLVKKFVEE
jgi:large subunit ribosomal protein L16